MFLVILFVVKSYDSFDIKPFKDLDILIGMMPVSLISITLLDRSHESLELTRDDPVHVSILNTLEVLIFFDIEGFEVIPLEVDSILESLQALKQSTIIETISLRCIPVWLE